MAVLDRVLAERTHLGETKLPVQRDRRVVRRGYPSHAILTGQDLGEGTSARYGWLKYRRRLTGELGTTRPDEMSSPAASVNPAVGGSQA